MTSAEHVPADEGSASDEKPPPVVVVVGAINVDLVIAAPSLPGPGETVVGEGLERHGGGKGANAAVAAARAGASVHLVGAVGADENGSSALDELSREGVDVTDVEVLPEVATGVALIVTAPDGENQIAVGAGANGGVTAEQVGRALSRSLAGAGCVLVSTEIPGDAVAAAVEAATEAGVRCILNPAPVIPEVVRLLRAGPLLTPNASESAHLARLVGDSPQPTDGRAGESAQAALAAPSAAALRLVRETSSPVVVTLGGDGALVVSPDGHAEHVPAGEALVRDTTGAGDTFNGVLATRLAAGDGLSSAVRAATAAAAMSVGHVGARTGMPHLVAAGAALHPA